MRITTIGRGSIGGTLARLWRAAGHDVTELGRGGGSAAGSDAVLVAVPWASVPDALAAVTDIGDAVVIDATNRLGGETPPSGHASMADYVKATTGGPVVKAFNLNFGSILDRAAAAEVPPQNIWVGDDAARDTVERLTRDMGMEPVHGGGLDRAATQEDFAYVFISIVNDLGRGQLFYRFEAPPAE